MKVLDTSTMRFSGYWLLLFVLLAAGPLKEGYAQVSDVSYTLSPTAGRIYWSDDAGLKDGNFFGGSLGFGFGEFVQLNGLYLFGNDFATDFSSFSKADSLFMQNIDVVGSRDVEMRRIGGSLRINLARGGFVPFASIGTGLLRYEPDGLAKIENIFLNAGLGVTFSVADRYTLSLLAENLSYRYNPAGFFSEEDLMALGASADNFEQTTVNNWGISGSLSLFLGGRRPGSLSDIDRAFQSQFSSGLRGISITAEPFIGQINFDESLGFRKNQPLLGVGASMDFGSYLGLRGFYWRGIDGDKLDDLQFYGGEMQFNLSSGEGVVPYLLFGGGYADVLDGYVGETGLQPKDKPFAIGGGGLVFPVSSRIKLYGGIRAILMSSDELENISDPNQVQSSYMFTGGLKFAVGGQQSARPDVLYRETMEEEVARLQIEAAAREAELNRALATSRSRSDSLSTAIVLAETRGDSLMAAKLRLEQSQQDATEARLEQASLVAKTAAQGAAAPMPQAVRTAQGDRIVTLPLPEEGEVYIRFGAPGGVNIESTFEGTNATPPPSPLPMQTTGSQEPPLTNEQIRAIMSETLQEAVRQQQAAIEQERTAIQAQLDAAQEEEEKTRLEERLRNLEEGTARPVPSPQKVETGAIDRAELDRVEQRMEARLMERFELLMAEIRSLKTVTPQQSATPVIVVQPDEEGRTGVEVIELAPEESADVIRPGYQFNHLKPYVGYNISHDPNQFLIGIRGEWQRKLSTSNVRFLPEVVFGFGEGSTMINPNLYLTIPVLDIQGVYPYVGGGLGLIGFLSAPDEADAVEATLNLLVGAELEMGMGRLFVEYANVDLSTYNRIGLGYRVQF